jgi:hypothetical protein
VECSFVGLYIVTPIIENVGFRIEVESNFGGGSIFKFLSQKLNEVQNIYQFEISPAKAGLIFLTF